MAVWEQYVLQILYHASLLQGLVMHCSRAQDVIQVIFTTLRGQTGINVADFVGINDSTLKHLH